MISVNDLYHILSAVVPLYVSMFLAYASVKWWKIFTPEQCAGINKFIALFSIPLFSFDFICAINLNVMNLRFIIADFLQKSVALISLFIWANFTKNGSLEWSITLFSISTLPNTLVLGIPLCKSMYGNFSTPLMIQVVFLQSLIWNNLLLILYEYRATKIIITEKFPGNVNDELRKSGSSNSRVSSVVSTRNQQSCKELGFDDNVIELSSSFESGKGGKKDLHLFERSLSTSALTDIRVGGGRGGGGSISAVIPHCGVDLHGVEEHPQDYENHELGLESRPDGDNNPNGLGPPASKCASCPGHFNIGPTEGPKQFKERPKSEPKPPARVMMIFTMVWRKLMRNPNAYASVLGLIWSLISNKFHIKMPEIVANSIGILSKTGLGMAMFSLGLFMALQPKIIGCGKRVAILTLAVRFIVGPMVMAATSLVVGLRGVTLQVAIVQAGLPQAITSFVFAKEYNIHAQILSTGVIFGMLISLPFTVAYYVLLGLI